MATTRRDSAPQTLSDARATRTVLLPESALIAEWRTWAETANSGQAPLDWFLALAAMSNPLVDLRLEEPVVMERLGPGLGVARSRPVTDGSIFRRHRELIKAFGEPAIDGAVTQGGAVLGLFQQARLATYLPYRDGLVRYLREVHITPEAAVHAYVRLVMDWAWQWSGLAVATRTEYDVSLKRARPKTSTDVARAKCVARAGLPLIVRWDLRSLLELVQSDAANNRAAEQGDWIVMVAVDAIVEQLSYAVAVMAADPSLVPLSAANFARSEANKGLGGALGRMQARAEHESIVALHVLEEVRRHFLDPVGDEPTKEDVEQRALMAKKFHLLRLAVEAMGAPLKEEDR